MEELTGYTGWGVWLIAAVLGFNLACIPAWFLVNNLRRTHEFTIKKVQTFLFLLAEQRDADKKHRTDAELDEAVAAIEEQVDKATGLGALWGRKHLALAQLSMHQMGDRWPELVERIDEAMQRG